MALLRDYLWLWVIIVICFVTVGIVLIFVLINKCISKKRGIQRISNLHRASDYTFPSDKFHERKLKDDTPPLPPRTQFLTTADTQSYENLAEAPNYVQSDADDGYEQSVPDYVQQSLEDLPNYVKMLDEKSQSYENLSAAPDYVQGIPDYEQSQEWLPDYVKVEEERQVTLSVPLPPYEDQASGNASTEDYDDIDAEELEEEDYDDVG